jgi:hypothetical protein
MGIELLFPSFDPDEHNRRCGSNAEDSAAARTSYSDLIVQEVRNAHQTGGVDLFLSYYYSREILPEAVDEIGALGPTVNFFCDSLDRFDEVAEISPHYDFCIVPEKEAVQKYREINANPVHLQMAANPEVYRPYELPMEYEVTFVGRNRFNRSEFVSYLLQNGVDIRVWGAGWLPRSYPFLSQPLVETLRGAKRLLRQKTDKPGSTSARYRIPAGKCGPPLSDDDLIRMYSRSRISLGFSELWDQQSNSYKRNIRLRDFEAPMSGAFYITGYQEEICEYYEVGKEIVCYEDKQDLLEKVGYYLKHDAEAQKIGYAGYQRALRDHTWQRRFEQLFQIIGLGNKRQRRALGGLMVSGQTTFTAKA